MASLRTWCDADTGAVLNDVRGENVPSVFGKDVGDEEIDFVARVGQFSAHRHNAIVFASTGDAQDRFDLNAPEGSADPNDKVIAVAFAPRFGNAESEIGGFAHEGELGDLAPMLAVEFDGMKKFLDYMFV